ncbi:MAG: GIY-YIG nuclease family protein [Cypionkella sp.]
MYVGVTSDLAARITQHREGTGSDFCVRYGLHRLVWADRGDRIEDCIAHEKRLKRWRREWKFDLVEQANPDWRDLFNQHKISGTICACSQAKSLPVRPNPVAISSAISKI